MAVASLLACGAALWMAACGGAEASATPIKADARAATIVAAALNAQGNHTQPRRLSCGVKLDYPHMMSLVDRTRGDFEVLRAALTPYFRNLIMPKVKVGCEFVSLTDPGLQIVMPPQSHPEHQSDGWRKTEACAHPKPCSALAAPRWQQTRA